MFTNNRFKSSFEEQDEKEKRRVINLATNLKSKKLPNYKFANYFESKLSQEYKLLSDIYCDYKKGIDIIEKYFNNLKFIGESKKIIRMFKIINEFTGVNYTAEEDMGHIFKLDLKDEYKNKSIRFYFYKIQNSYNLLLTDLYHLVIYTNSQNVEKDYKKVEKYSGNILLIK